MSIVNMIKMIKEIHPETVVLIKSGVFYNVYDKDAYIIAYLCRYKIKTIDYGFPVCGFPKIKINMVTNLLKSKKIDFAVLDKADQYDKIDSETFKDLNNYNNVYNSSYTYVTAKKRIDEIYNYLTTNMSGINEVLTKIEDVIDQSRKISNS